MPNWDQSAREIWWAIMMFEFGDEGDEILAKSKNATQNEQDEAIKGAIAAWEKVTGEKPGVAYYEDGIAWLKFGDWKVKWNHGVYNPRFEMYRLCFQCGEWNAYGNGYSHQQIENLGQIYPFYEKAKCNNKRKCRKFYGTKKY